MITNDTIIKAAKAAGISVQLHSATGKLAMFGVVGNWFDPLENDADNASIRRSVDIDVVWVSKYAVAMTYIVIRGLKKRLRFKQEIGSDKDQAEREAVILCAAAKWDAVNEGVK